MIHPRYVIPSIISILGLCVGLSSIKFALNSQFEHAVIAITIASIIDTIDGRIARLIKGTSKFGAELDSLIDFINFGVAPAITVYIWILKDLGNIGWLLVLFHSVACCLRLARFNLGSKMNNEKWRENFFTGVPSPAGAGILLLQLILLLSYFSSNYDYRILAIIFIIASTFLMISKIPTYSLKGIKVSRPFLIFLLLLIATYFGFLIHYPFNTLLFTGYLYLLLIPISFIHFKIIKKRSSKASDSLISEDFI
ncbi:MAG: CDP-alcohol phosphatidyltransferase family protein [Candidatus Fonsibacter sp.]